MTLRPYSATLQAAYRDTLGTPGAPEVIDDSIPVQPVAVVAQVNTASTASYTQVTDGTDTLGVSSSGGMLNVIPTFSGAAPTHVQFAFTMTGAVATAYTVTTGKTFYAVGWTSEDTTGSITFYANDGTTKVHYGRDSGGGAPNPTSHNGAFPFAKWTSGQAVKINGTNTIPIFVWGWEE